MLKEQELWQYGLPPQEEEQMQERRRRKLLRRRSFSEGWKGRDDRGWTLLHIGSRKGDIKEVRRLLDEGIDVNVPAWGPKSQGETPLHLAAQGGHIKVMDELLERGANIDARTKGACGLQPSNGTKKRSSFLWRMVPSCLLTFLTTGSIHPSITAAAWNGHMRSSVSKTWASQAAAKLLAALRTESKVSILASHDMKLCSL